MKLLGRIKDVREGLMLALAGSFMLCIYAPIELFLSSQDDFWFTIGTLTGVSLAMFGVIFAVLAIGFIVARLISRVVYNIGLLLGTSVLLICYAQGNFLCRAYLQWTEQMLTGMQLR